MASCTSPILCWYPTDDDGNIVEGVSPVFRWDDVTDDNWVQSATRCNKCDSCAAHYKTQWAVRCGMEMYFHESSCCLTLTYDQEHIPKNEMLCKKDVQDFMKRFRRWLERNMPKQAHPITGEIDHHKIRYLYCGEYGSNGGRPHYHAMIFGYDFPDKVVYKQTPNSIQYQSDLLDELWGKGIATIGEGGMKAAFYVAGYIAKKLQTEKFKGKNFAVDQETGEIIFKDSEFLEMSRRPAIGRWYYDKWKSDIYPSDQVHLLNNGRLSAYPVPTYFDKVLRQDDPELWQRVKEKRISDGIAYAIRNPHEKSYERLRVKAYLKRREQEESKRPLDGKDANYHIDLSDVDRKHKNLSDYEREIHNKQIFDNLLGNGDEAHDEKLNQKIEAAKRLKNDPKSGSNSDEKSE